MNTVAIVGPGRLGSRLALALAAAGWSVVAVRGRRRVEWSAERLQTWRAAGLPEVSVWSDHDEALSGADVVVLSVPDDRLEALAREHGGAFGADAVLLHCSGSQSAAVLESARLGGRALVALHPLQTFPEWPAPTTFSGVWMAIDGDERGCAMAELIAAALDGHPWRIAPEAKSRYHLGASLAANLAHVLVCEGRAQLAASGLGESAGAALAPLVHAAVAAALEARGLEALTGPLSRGDDGTVAGHLELLDEPSAAVYRSLIALVRERLVDGCDNGPRVL